MRWHPDTCSRCGAKAGEHFPISARGLCVPCAQDAVATSIDELHERRGPTYRKWLDTRLRSLEKQRRGLERELARLELVEAQEVA